MPKAQAKKEHTAVKAEPVSKPLAEGMARVRHKKDGKVIDLDAIHALSVLFRQGNYDILEHKATIADLTTFCDRYEIRYPGGASKDQLVALVKAH